MVEERVNPMPSRSVEFDRNVGSILDLFLITFDYDQRNSRRRNSKN